jgi:enoyl-CoA hydratase
MALENILARVESDVLVITINRPDKLNALNKQTIEEIRTALRQAYDEPAIAGAIITGEGPKAFVAGADISEFMSYSNDEARGLSAHGHEVFNYIEHCPKPVIAAVNGFALGGGCELAMACHLRIASENAKFGQPEVNLGLIPGYAGTQRLVRYVGRTKALELLMTADMITAQDALSLGLVNAVVPQADLLKTCFAMMDKIKSKSPMAIAEIIRCVNAYDETGIIGMNAEIESFGGLFGTDDFHEGVGAFLEKRKASFRRG